MIIFSSYFLESFLGLINQKNKSRNYWALVITNVP
jgi:hypothetical protein